MADLKGNVESGDVHQEILELLPWYLNGTLEASERDQVEHHLQSCSSCQRESEELMGLQSVVLEEAVDYSEIYLQDALQIVKSSGKKSEEREELPRESEKPKRKRKRERSFVLRPRLALSFTVLLFMFMVAGIYIGNVIADRPESNNPGTELPVNVQQRDSLDGVSTNRDERSFEESGGVIFLAREILSTGTFRTVVGSTPVSDEDFTLERFDDGTLSLGVDISTNRAGQTGQQDLHMDSNWRPLTYSVSGGVVYQANSAEASVQDDHALFTLSKTTENLVRRVELQGFPVMNDFSMFSQFMVIHQVILNQVSAGIAMEDIEFTALTPQVLRSQQMRVESVENATLETGGGSITTKKYRLVTGTESSPFVIDIYEVDSELIAIYHPQQEGLATTSGLFTYRTDLYERLIAPSE